MIIWRALIKKYSIPYHYSAKYVKAEINKANRTTWYNSTETIANTLRRLPGPDSQLIISKKTANLTIGKPPPKTIAEGLWNATKGLHQNPRETLQGMGMVCTKFNAWKCKVRGIIPRNLDFGVQSGVLMDKLEILQQLMVKADSSISLLSLEKRTDSKLPSKVIHIPQGSSATVHKSSRRGIKENIYRCVLVYKNIVTLLQNLCGFINNLWKLSKLF